MNTSQQTPQSFTHVTIASASAVVLRAGVIISALTMLVGILFTFVHGTISVQRLTHDRFDFYPAVICDGIRHGHGKSIIEAGIYLLVFTPILRVLTSSVLFVFQERDWLYAVITLTVLALTLAGLLWIG